MAVLVLAEVSPGENLWTEALLLELALLSCADHRCISAAEWHLLPSEKHPGADCSYRKL